jgi:single-stranded DNA-binding protein
MSSEGTPGGRAILVGRVVAVPTLRATAGGYCMATLRIATSHAGPDAEGRTEEHRLIVFGRLAESLGSLPEGRVVYAEGRWQARHAPANWSSTVSYRLPRTGHPTRRPADSAGAIVEGGPPGPLSTAQLKVATRRLQQPPD